MKNICWKLVESMPNRLRAVIRNKGGHIDTEKLPKKKATQFDKEVLDMLGIRSAVHDSSDDTHSANEAEKSRC
ncbi:hypothetical protein ANN_26407 [Periplaneta americana]|uniref:Uncharacterized protein n=1 Tax=Periplaneta americana TaxID=6978 RepID=A0ABQ8RY42_PERAM|nr:hypothetical protein ANN_26407 [Periplaneta americana]